jgi:hypothetical protein
MTPDPREPIYQTKVSAIPLYRFEAIARRGSSPGLYHTPDTEAVNGHVPTTLAIPDSLSGVGARAADFNARHIHVGFQRHGHSAGHR